MSNKPITIRVSTVKLLEALTKALAERKKVLTDQDKEAKAYEQATKEFQDSLAELFRSGKGKVVTVSKSYAHRYNNENNRYELTIEFPASVKAPKEPEASNAKWQLNSDIEELENAIAILTLSDEEYVSTSTYKGVARFIK